MSVQGLIAVHPKVVELFQSGPEIFLLSTPFSELNFYCLITEITDN